MKTNTVDFSLESMVLIVRIKIWLFFIFFVVLLGINSQALATSWVTLDPEEVVNRSEIVVLGKYDISSEKITGESSLFEGVKFKVKKVYKGGDVGTEIVAGLNGFDFGWVEEFQREGGELILFLENSQSSFLTPVGGPNGMVQINEGEIIDPVLSRKQFFEDFLQSIEQEKSEEIESSKQSSAPKPVKERSTWNSIGTQYLPILTIGIILLLVLFMGRWLIKKK